MRVVRRPLSPGEFDHELVWLVVTLGTFAAGAVWLKLGFPLPHCPFLAMTGYPCLTCGATRCAIAFAHGDFPHALTWNPLATIALLAVLLFDLYAVIVLVARGPRLRIVEWTRREQRFARILVIGFLLLNWAWLLAHRAQY